MTLTADDKRRVVSAYSWFLRRIGPDGVKLTSAGYLPPVVVEDVARELDLDREWIGANNREHHTIPVLGFRESAQSLGLVRKYKGYLRRTTAGHALVDDPQRLWDHIAHRLPLGRREVEQEAGMLALLVVAAGDISPWDADVLLAALLAACGWQDSSGSLRPLTAFHQARATWDVLYRLGAVTEHFPREGRTGATPLGSQLARAALAPSR